MTRDPEFDFVKGEEQATFGMNLAAEARRGLLFRVRANHWLSKQPPGRVFTADNMMREGVELPSEGANKNNAVGAWFGAQSKAGRIEFTGRMKKSSRVDRHVGLQREWRVL